MKRYIIYLGENRPVGSIVEDIREFRTLQEAQDFLACEIAEEKYETYELRIINNNC